MISNESRNPQITAVIQSNQIFVRYLKTLLKYNLNICIALLSIMKDFCLQLQLSSLNKLLF